MTKSPWRTFTKPEQEDKSIKDYEAIKALPKINLKARKNDLLQKAQSGS